MTLPTDIFPDSLLRREPSGPSRLAHASSIRGRTALVTGAAGSVGSEICTQLARAGIGTLVTVDLDENGLYLMQRAFDRAQLKTTVAIEVADIRDRNRIHTLFERHGPQDVFHAAAHKHVPLMEASPCEAIKNNVLATQYLAGAAADYGAARFVYISTDKAVRPTSVMGATKRVGEQIVRALAPRSSTRFCAVRFGNVLGSGGSVVPIFRAEIAAGGPVRVTHEGARRYFMTIREAVALLLEAGYGNAGPLCVLNMGEPVRIVDLARDMIRKAGLEPDVDIPIVYTGLRPGEKLCEELLAEDEEIRRTAHGRILVVDGPPPPADLEDGIAKLAEAASAEQSFRVVKLLAGLVPSYAPTSEGLHTEPSKAGPAPPIDP